MIPFNWTYYGLIHWCIFFIFFYQLAIRRDMTNLKAFTLATLATLGGGWLYEVPFWYPVSMFLTRYSIFYLNTQIVCLLCLIYEIRRMGFKSNKLILTMGLIFLVFSGILSSLRVVPHIKDTALNHLLKANIWFYRVPASLFLLSLLSGVKENG